MLRRGATGVLLAIGLGFALAGPASAHSVLIAMTPTDGSLVMVAPSQVVLTFDSPIQDIGDVVIVVGPDGTHAETGSPVIVNNVVTVALKPITVPGHYRVAYRVTSTDGHPVTRELGFDYLTATAADTTAGLSAGGGTSAVPLVVAVAAVLAIVATWVVISRRRSQSGGGVR
jgi:methionine-rich copper-binding protein CopC